jgi:hypothetical protein
MTIFGTILISLIAVLIAAITSYNVFENDHISSTFGKMLTSLFMSIGFVAMHAVVVGRIVLTCVWLFHVIYFLFGVKTLKGASE